MKKNNSLTGKSRAQAMVEFAIALPVLLLLLYGILEAGRLLFLYSTVVTASRQAVRYGSATGQGENGVLRYQDCAGIRKTANAFGLLGAFDKIEIFYDTGPGTTPVRICQDAGLNYINTDSRLNTDILEGNRARLEVKVTEPFAPLVRLVPFSPRDVHAESFRTILYSVPIVVDQPQQNWDKTATTLTITSDNPDPSEINQQVLVTVELKDDQNNALPGAVVRITGADENCNIPLNHSTTGSCYVKFITSGDKVLTAIYDGDTDYLGSSDTEDHTVTLYNTTTTILSDQPDFSLTGAAFTVTVQVTSTVKATGTVTVTVDEGGSTGCTIILSNGAGGCTMSIDVPDNPNPKTLRAKYNPDSSHVGSEDTESHSVLDPTPTPTLTPTATFTPSPTLTPTPAITPTPSFTPTNVPSCNLVTHSAIVLSGNTMSMTINNPYIFPIVMQNVTVTWNHDKGHSVGNKKLALTQAAVGSTVIFGPGGIANGPSYTMPAPVTLLPGTNTAITFTFDKTYDNLDTSERIYITLSTPGCQSNPIDGK
jgi:hypothetical protein